MSHPRDRANYPLARAAVVPALDPLGGGQIDQGRVRRGRPHPSLIGRKSFVELGSLAERTPGSASEITERVREQYLAHPFPPPQRKHSYKDHAAFVRRLLGDLGLDPTGWRFGDIACGTGLMMLDYALEFPEARFTGYDLSEAAVERANSTIAEAGLTNAHAAAKNILELDDEAAFDYILSWGTVHHLADPEAGILKLCRALAGGGVLRLGVYGYYGNWERRLQQEIVGVVGGDLPLDERIGLVRDWAESDPGFSATTTEPPVDLADDAWIVDEFLHVWERPLRLRDLVVLLDGAGLDVVRLTDYYDEEIPLDPALHLREGRFAERARHLPFEQRCHLVELLARPYWLSLIARKRLDDTAG
jgi:SAM-dependent methyltransferase